MLRKKVNIAAIISVKSQVKHVLFVKFPLIFLMEIQGASRETDVLEMDVTEQVEGVEAWVGAIKLVRPCHFS
jgi:hypothetical protein